MCGRGPSRGGKRPARSPTERGRFDRARMLKLLKRLYLHQKHCRFRDLDSLKRLLFSHGFLLFRDPR